MTNNAKDRFDSLLANIYLVKQIRIIQEEHTIHFTMYNGIEYRCYFGTEIQYIRGTDDFYDEFTDNFLFIKAVYRLAIANINGKAKTELVE